MLVTSLPTLLLGCAGGLFGGNDGTSDGPGKVTDNSPLITMTMPTAGDKRYGELVQSTFEVDNFTLDPDGIDQANVEGHGHVHAYVDGVMVGETAELNWDFIGLLSGSHTVEVRLAENDHTERWEGSWAYLDTLDSKLSILSPVDGTQYTSSSAPLVLQMTDFTTALETAFGDPTFGAGRYNILVDGQVTDYGFDQAAVEVTQIPEGTHTVGVELVTADGLPLDPPVTDTVNVEVLPASPFVAIDRSPFLGEYNSATIPLDITVANAAQEYHLYVDGVYFTGSTEPQVTVTHVAAGYHEVELRLTNAGSELPIHDHLHLMVAEGRPDITITYPGDQWGVPAAFSLTVNPENFTLDPAAMGKTNEPGHGHYAVLVDGVELTKSAASSAAISGLTTGPHVIEVQLQNNDNTPVDPPVYTAIHVHAT